MLRTIVCQQCNEAIREDDLFIHLVREHHWKPARRDTSLSGSTVVDRSAPREKRQPVPRLGPMKPSVSSANYAPEVCKHCRKPVDPKLMTEHLLDCQVREQEYALKRASERMLCPHCSQPINKKNLGKHIKKVHPAFAATSATAAAQPFNKTLPPVQCRCPYCNVMINPKKYSAHVQKRCPKRPAESDTVKLPNTCHDPAIAAYMARVSAPNEVGKYGKPQAKIRHGTYGLSNMEYDAWGRNE